MNSFFIKEELARVFDIVGILDMCFLYLRIKTRDNYIRVINYHGTTEHDKNNFEMQLKWYKNFFTNINYLDFEAFMKGERRIQDKPGLMITFDDGFKDNFDVALPLLNKYRFTGYFFVSADLIGTEGYLSHNDLRQLVMMGHKIGCHTSTHHRMNVSDSDDVLNYEIIESKKKIEALLNEKIEIFCWCGGEESTYTRNAAIKIKEAGYKYSFMTNSSPVKSNNDFLQIQRTNVESSWTESLLKFQLSGIMDIRFLRKRLRVNKLTDV